MEYRGLGKYQLQETLASGGMGEVIRSVDHQGRVFALKKVLKEYQDNPHFRDLFRREAEITFSLDHPNIVKAYGFDRVGHQQVLVLEFLNGVNLRQLLKKVYDQQSFIPIPIAIQIARLILRGLTYAHGRRDRLGFSLGIVHRDLNPSNIFVTFSGEVKILDFGISKATEKSMHDLTPRGEMRGKAAYLAPEQIQNTTIDQRADLFAVGIVLWELLAAQPLFRRDSKEASFSAILTQSKPAVNQFRKIPEALETIISKALQNDVYSRYQSADEFERDLTALSVELYPSACLPKDLSVYVREQFGDLPETKEASFEVARLWIHMMAEIETEEAFQMIAQLAFEFPSDPYIQFTYARALLQSGKKSDALSMLRRLVKDESIEDEVQSMLEYLGVRRRPVIRFLKRSHILNHALGRARHKILGPTPFQAQFAA